MAVASAEWLKLIDEEYLRTFIVTGGAGVKFVVADASELIKLETAFGRLVAEHGIAFAGVDSANVKIHMMQDIFFAVARQLDWAGDAQRFVEGLFKKNGYEWPRPGHPVLLKDVAEANDVDATILRKEMNTWLTHDLMRDPRMAQDFRIATTQLCQNRLAPANQDSDIVAPILQWLRGELTALSALKSAQIFSKINRYNSRSMLRSLCRWLVLAGHRGLFVSIDIRHLTHAASTELDDGLRYAPGAVMDAYEVLRQLIDDSSMFERFFLVVLADEAFIGGDQKRSVDAYTALKMRIWDDVRARARANPLAPMVILNR